MGATDDGTMEGLVDGITLGAATGTSAEIAIGDLEEGVEGFKLGGEMDSVKVG